jgi:hypothetical protein
LKQALDLHIEAITTRAKSYPDWENNQALAALEQRDSKALETLTPRELTIEPSIRAYLQLTGRLWRIAQSATNSQEAGDWVPPGSGTAHAVLAVRRALDWRI